MDLQIGENIRKIRELKGYSQEYMAGKLDISQRAYSNIESQNNKIDADRLKAVAEVLEVNPLDILTFDDKILFSFFQILIVPNLGSVCLILFTLER